MPSPIESRTSRDVADEEAVVLEDGEDAEVEDDTPGGEPLAQPLVLGAMDRHHGELADQRDRGQQQAEAGVGRRVEDVACDDDERLPELLPGHQRPGEGEDDREEDREFDGGEEHGRQGTDRTWRSPSPPLLPCSRPPRPGAGCGGVETATPKHKVAPRPPLAIGDSSMLLALPALARVGYKANARGCRQFAEGLRLLRDARAPPPLPHLVVLALGADASVSGGQIQQAKKILGPKRKLGLVTPRELGGGRVERRGR